MEKDSHRAVHADNLEMVHDTLEAARPHGLEAEVMWSALTFAAEANEHNESLADVLEAALGEWDL
jgi:isopropylmalate/homocitrate/citramalate synthase